MLARFSTFRVSCNSCQEYPCTHKSSTVIDPFVSFVLIITVSFLLLWLPFPALGFDADCCGLVWFCSQLSWPELLQQLLRPIQHVYLPPNELADYQNSLSIYFRPGMLFFHYLAYQLFGAQPHAYHGITVFWHALSGCGLYTILRSYYTLQISLFLVFAFLFHPALTPAYIGVTSHVAPTYPLLIGSVIAYLYTQKKQKKSFLLLALFCFFASLTCYEIAAVLPLLFFSYEFFWPALQKKKNQEQKNRSLNNNTSNPMLKKRAVNALRKSAPFWATLAVYLLTRALLIMQAPVNALPISTSEMHSSREVIGEQLRSQSSKTLTYQVLFWLKKIAHNSRQALRPLWGCPQTSPLVPAGITFLYALLFLFTFISAPYKRKRLLWCLFCGIIAAWPLFIVTADGRYLYAALPFFLVTLYELFKTIQHYLFLFQYKKIGQLFPAVALAVTCCIFAQQAVNRLQLREKILAARDHAFTELAHEIKESTIKQLIFLGTVHYYCGDTLIMQQGMTQKAKLAGITEQQIFHCTQAKFFITTPDGAPYTITQHKNERSELGLRFHFPDPERCSLMIDPGQACEKSFSHSMGRMIIHEKYKPWLASSVTFIIDPYWLTGAKVPTAIYAFDLSRKKFNRIATV